MSRFPDPGNVSAKKYFPRTLFESSRVVVQKVEIKKIGKAGLWRQWKVEKRSERSPNLLKKFFLFKKKTKHDRKFLLRIPPAAHLPTVENRLEIENHRHGREEAEAAEQRHNHRAGEPIASDLRNAVVPVAKVVCHFVGEARKQARRGRPKRPRGGGESNVDDSFGGVMMSKCSETGRQ